MSQTRVTITEQHATTRLTVSPIGLQGLPGNDSLTADELAAIQGAATPSAANVFATMDDVVAGSGTVTSVAVTGSDGIQVDSGSPITGAGTVALGIDAATLAAHLGLGSAAYTPANDYATTGQGALATTSLQPSAIGVIIAAYDDPRFTAISVSGSGVNFFPTDTAIVPASANNTYPIKTLSDAPSGAAEDVDSITIPSNSTMMYGTYLSPVLINSKLDGGIWEFHIYAGVDSATGVTTLTENVYRVRPATGTVTVTGTGTSRTCTASGGTPFATANINASAVIADCSFVQTPLGLYPITARTSDTVVTITTPSGYTNEAAVAFSIHKKLFGVTSAEINNTAGTGPAYTGIILLPEIQSVQADIPLVAGDRIATSFFGTASAGATRTLYFSHDGTNRYTHFHTPLETILPAESVVVAFTPTNYTPASATVEAHLAAIDAALGALA